MVLKPTCREIAKKCGVAIKWTPKKRGRKVIGLYFTADFEAEIHLGFDFDREATDTRRLTLVGRITFPAEYFLRSLLGSGLREKHRQGSNAGPRPGRREVPRLVPEKAIAPNAKGIEKTFATFCRGGNIDELPCR